MRILLVLISIFIIQITQAQDDFFNQELKELIQDAEDNFSAYTGGLMETDKEEWKEMFVNIDIPHMAFDGKIHQFDGKYRFFFTSVFSHTDELSEEENLEILQKKILQFPTELGYEITLIQHNDFIVDYVIKSTMTQKDVAFIKLNLLYSMFEMNPIMDINAIINNIEAAAQYSLNDFADIKDTLKNSEKEIDYYTCNRSFDYFNYARIAISSDNPKLELYMYYYSPYALVYQLGKEVLSIKGMKKTKKAKLPKNAIYYQKFCKNKQVVSISIFQTDDGGAKIHIQSETGK